MYVVFHHIGLYVNDDLPADGVARKVCNYLLYGHYSVVIFIVLSGFCLMLPVVGNQGQIAGGAMTFFRKRAWRILPPYFLVLALSLLLIWLFIGTSAGTIWRNSLPLTPGAILTHILLIQDWWASTATRINYSLWSISIEWRIYFLFPVLVYCWGRVGPYLTVAATVVLSTLLLIPLQYSSFDSMPDGACLHFYGLFALGLLAAGLGYSEDPGLSRWRARLPWASLSLAMAAVTIVLNKVHQTRVYWQFQDISLGFAAMCLLVAVVPSVNSDRWRWVRGALGWTPLVFVGTFSYSLYLLHAPLLEIIWVYFVHPMHLTAAGSFALMGTGGFVVVVALSYLFFLFCERPFMRLRKSRILIPEPAAQIMDPEAGELIPEKARTAGSSFIP